MSHDSLLESFTAGRRAALSRAITIVENERAGFRDVLAALHSRLGRAHRIGITGPPGAGKSTLTAALIEHYRQHDERVGVIAVDPTSPFTGGALLGDRIRMNEISLDAGVFIRSMATRGSLGGLALATKEVADVMDAYGFDRVIVETVGVGQSELDIASAADSTVVVLVPESGDAIQAMKAGLMEAADLFVINKSDRPGADRLAREVSMMLHLRSGNVMRNVPAHHGVNLAAVKAGSAARRSVPDSVNVNAPSPVESVPSWEIPVLKTIAETRAGVTELAQSLDSHRSWLTATGELSRRRRKRITERVRDEVARRLQRVVWEEQGGAALLEESLHALEDGSTTPYEVAARIAERILPAQGTTPG
jgi:LAO/AO transport system kinase